MNNPRTNRGNPTMQYLSVPRSPFRAIAWLGVPSGDGEQVGQPDVLPVLQALVDPSGRNLWNADRIAVDRL